jgi:hypothetical protein
MIGIGKLFSSAGDILTSRITDKDIEDLQESVRALNYELTLLRYKDSDDEDIRLACEYLKKRPFCAALYPYEKMRDLPPIEVHTDKDLKMCYVMHNGHPLYFPKGENEKMIRWLYRYAIEDDDIVGNGYRQRSPHAYQSERYHIEKGDVLIDAGGGKCLLPSEVIDDVITKVSAAFSKNAHNGEWNAELDVGSARGLLALDVIDKVSKVYMVERAPRWWKPIEATFAPYKDKVELVKGTLSAKKKKKEKKEKEAEEKKRKMGLADLLEKCGQQRVFVMMDIEGHELEVLSDAQEYLKAAQNPITLAVCAYHRTTDYADLMRLFEAIGYHTETQPGYMYTDMNDGHGIRSFRKCIVRASNF